MSNMYMHLIEGKPAMYEDGRQIVYINRWSRVTEKEVFVDSLDTIRKQQKLSQRWRAKRGMDDYILGKYSYLRIKKAES